MDQRTWYRDAGVLPEWVETIRVGSRTLGWTGVPAIIRGWMNGTEFITCVRSLGGTVRTASPFHGWVLAVRDHGPTVPIVEFAPELVRAGVHVDDFSGLISFELDGTQYLALRINEQVFPGQVERALLLAGASLEAILELASRLKAERARLFREEIRVYGAEAKPTGLGLVTEDDLLLPVSFKSDLLAYLDRFWRGAELCAKLGIAPTRGVLFVGAPGTGKTLTVRHILHRYAHCQRFLFVTESPAAARSLESPFRVMLCNIVELGEPAVVVLEDIDRLLESGVVTAEFFLNVLDGLFQPRHPVLWVATSNDPTRLEQNLLDRPGRFDRIFVFPYPTQTERVDLLRRYSPWPLEREVLEEAARKADGLTGAHLKEACLAAALRVVDNPAAYSLTLPTELAKVAKQHEQARSYDFAIKSRQLGFEVKTLGQRP